jgi:hypothetical protein
MPDAKPQRKVFPIVLLTALTISGLLAIAYVAIQFWMAYHTHGLINADVKDKLDSYKVQVDDLQRLVSLLVTFSSLYALVLGVSSYLSAQGLITQSEKNAKQIEDLRKDLEKTYPFLRGMGERMNALKDRLEMLMPDSDERSDYFDRLKAHERLELEAAEQSAITWLHFLDFSGSGAAEIAADIYRNLGKYRGAQYKQRRDELKRKKDANRGSTFPEEEKEVELLSHRAEFFLNRSKEKNPNSFLVYNDLAYLTQDIEGESSQNAAKWYSTSLRYEKKQQRAPYNLAIIHYFNGQYEEAEKCSSEALENTNWQVKPSAERKADVLYNRACYRSLLGKEEAAKASPSNGELKKWEKLVKEDLVEVGKVKVPTRVERIKEDRAAGGDFEWFASRDAAVLDDLAKKLA